MYKSYKVRLFPTKEQEELFYKHINCTRFIWNKMLDLHNKYYEETGKTYSEFDMKKMVTKLRNSEEYDFLKEVSSTSLKIICGDLHLAFVMFFKRVNKYPRFKSKKKQKKSFPIRSGDGKLYFKEDFVKIEKIGRVKYQTKNKDMFTNNTKFVNPRISLVNNKWILSFGIEYENQVFNLSDKVLGIDLGIKELAVCSLDGEKLVFHNINKSKRMRNLESKLRHIQRVVARKYRTNKSYDKTNGIIKYENMIRKISYKISCIRENYIHQVTHKLVSYLPKRIVMEDLAVSNLMKNRHLAKAIQDQCFYKFISTIKYKAEWYGIEFIQVGRFYPSSKTCSCCGSIKKNLKLSDRTYKCNECGLEIDRDFNAAINLMNYEV